MDRVRAAAGSIAFLVVAPGSVTGLLPWWITGWRTQPAPRWWPVVAAFGGVLIAAGVVVLIAEFVRFVVQGIGTPAPVAPTRHLVVAGLYRYVRNPMYLAVIAILVGQTLVFASLALLAYTATATATAAMVAFVRWYEEPALLARHGPDYEAYRRAVPGWLPRRGASTKP